MLDARCQTTAMGIMPHTDIERALDLALSLDVPFWPQLPNVSFYEDMYAQTSENFPGIRVIVEDKRLDFDTRRFEAELAGYSENMNRPDTFSLSPRYSVVFHKFLERDLSGYAAIRGQITGPVSFGFKVVDENQRPIIYNDDVRTILFDFIQRKVNTQYQSLKQKNSNAFVWVDEPGLGWVFSGLSGYDDLKARRDYETFLAGIEGPKGLHLCANVNLPYLLGLGIDILSFDAFQIEVMPKGYTEAVAKFLEKGGIISWGLVPTDSINQGVHSPESLSQLLLGYWEAIARHTGFAIDQIARQSLIAPARCCLKNIGQVGGVDDSVCLDTGQARRNGSIEQVLVERAFAYTGEIAIRLQKAFQL